MAVPTAHIEINYQLRLSAEFESSVKLKINAPRLVLTGASGAGKTILFKVFSGEKTTTNAQIAFNGQWFEHVQNQVHLPVHKRKLGLVPQERLLFPHLNVQKNLLYFNSLFAKNEMSEVAEYLEIDHLLKRWPQELSLGEQQRVAIGRALLSQPQLLLLDEPLSHLDERRKSKLMDYLLNIHQRWSLPMLYITHNPAEVERMASHQLHIENGRLHFTSESGGYQ